MNTIAIRKTNLSEQCYEVIRGQMLEGGRYRPGEKISVERMTRELGVSRSPVWAAINRLSAEGIVEVRPRDGVFFIGFDARHLKDLFAVREELEAMAARLAASRLAAAGCAIDDLEASLERQARAVAAGDRESYAREGSAFHGILVGLAGNAALADTLTRILSQIRAMCHARVVMSGFQEDYLADHRAIARAIAAGDGGAADAATRAHVRRLVAEL